MCGVDPGEETDGFCLEDEDDADTLVKAAEVGAHDCWVEVWACDEVGWRGGGGGGGLISRRRGRFCWYYLLKESSYPNVSCDLPEERERRCTCRVNGLACYIHLPSRVPC